jgi:hypothetical protein
MTDVSPELALVDPALRAAAVAELTPVEPFEFLRFDRRPAAIVDFGFLAEHEEVEPVRWRPPLLVAASVYAASSLARVIVLDGLFVLGLAAAIAVLNTFG